MATKSAPVPPTFVEVRAEGKRHPNVSAIRRFQLVVTSGSIVACDPSTGKAARPVVEGVEPGKYPVFLYVPTHGGVGVAELRLSEEPVTTWKKASSYDSLAGFGCFADKATALHQHYRRVEAEDSDSYVDDVLNEALKNEGGTFRTAPRAQENVVLFNSAYSDVRCQNYVGLDARGRPVCVVTDMGIIQREPEPAAVADQAQQKLAGTVAEIRRILGSVLVGLGFVEGAPTYKTERLFGPKVCLPYEKGRIVILLETTSSDLALPNIWIGLKGRSRNEFDAVENIALKAGVKNIPFVLKFERFAAVAGLLTKHWAKLEPRFEELLNTPHAAAPANTRAAQPRSRARK